MPAVAAISLSGMHAAQRTLRAGAHNVANLGTEGFRREQVVQATNPGGGVLASVTSAVAPGHELLSDVVGQIQSRNAFIANLAVFKASDRMTGSLLDVLA